MDTEKLWNDSFDVITDAVSLHDTAFKILKINKAFSDSFHVTQEDAVGKQCHELLHKKCEICSGCPFNDVLLTGKTCRKEIYEPSMESYLEITAYPVFDSNSHLEGILHFAKDITLRKRMEENTNKLRDELDLRVKERTAELQEAYDRLHKLAAHLQSVREKERIKISRQIHDELGQTLSAFNMELSWFRNTYGDHKPIFDKAGSMLEALHSTLKSLRRICTELRPSILDDFGLVETMKWQASEFQTQTRIRCTVDSVPEEITIDKKISTALFRIFQEALANILKHARATKVNAIVTKNSGSLTLEIIDNGKGVTEDQLLKSQSFGLMSMRESVYQWRGEVTISGYKNRGTILKITLPSPADDAPGT